MKPVYPSEHPLLNRDRYIIDADTYSHFESEVCFAKFKAYINENDPGKWQDEIADVMENHDRWEANLNLMAKYLRGFTKATHPFHYYKGKFYWCTLEIVCMRLNINLKILEKTDILAYLNKYAGALARMDSDEYITRRLIKTSFATWVLLIFGTGLSIWVFYGPRITDGWASIKAAFILSTVTCLWAFAAASTWQWSPINRKHFGVHIALMAVAFFPFILLFFPAPKKFGVDMVETLRIGSFLTILTVMHCSACYSIQLRIKRLILPLYNDEW